MAYSDRDIRLWAVETGKSVLNLKQEDQVSSLALSPDGRLLASDVGGTAIRIWNVATGKAIHELNIDEWSVNCVTFSPDSKVLASGENRIVENSNGVGCAIRLWDLESGKELCLLVGHRGRIRSAAFSFDGKTLASGGDDETVRLWNMTTGRQLRNWKGQVVSASHVVFSPDGRTVAAAGLGGNTLLWDVATGKERWNVWIDGESLAFSPDGRTLAVGW